MHIYFYFHINIRFVVQLIAKKIMCIMLFMAFIKTLEKYLIKFGATNSPTYVVIGIVAAKGGFALHLLCLIKKKSGTGNLQSYKRYNRSRNISWLDYRSGILAPQISHELVHPIMKFLKFDKDSQKTIIKKIL